MGLFPHGPRDRLHAAGWRPWLLPLGGAAVVFALLAIFGPSSRPRTLNYTQFVADVDHGAVRTVSIGPAGQVSGTLDAGDRFTTGIPVALGDRTLAARLAAHHVQITATTNGASPSALSVLVGLLPLLLILALFVFGMRGVRRQATRLNQLSRTGGGLTTAKARVIDSER